MTRPYVREAALAASWEGRPVWANGDVTASNLLVLNGHLSAVVDFGCSAVGDPACDRVISWTFLLGDSSEAFRGRLALDEGTWGRARLGAARRFGWRLSARDVVEAVLADPKHWLTPPRRPPPPGFSP